MCAHTRTYPMHITMFMHLHKGIGTHINKFSRFFSWSHWTVTPQIWEKEGERTGPTWTLKAPCRGQGQLETTKL